MGSCPSPVSMNVAPAGPEASLAVRSASALFFPLDSSAKNRRGFAGLRCGNGPERGEGGTGSGREKGAAEYVSGVGGGEHYQVGFGERQRLNFSAVEESVGERTMWERSGSSGSATAGLWSATIGASLL